MHPPLTHILDRLRRLAARPGARDDADLLGRFARYRDEEAFAALMARHGPMVFNVCFRVLGDVHAAEDATQATFLVLARKAGALRLPGRLPAWLYGVAQRVARKHRRATARRLVPADPASEPVDPGPDPLAVLSGRDLLRVLEEEIGRLPGAYRLPVVLCCLEGLSQEEAARRLGCTAGSVKGRLERGRTRLHAQLVRRGLTLTAALAAVEVSRGVTRAYLSPALSGSTARAAAAFAGNAHALPASVSHGVIALAYGGLRDMFTSKLKVVAVLLVVAGVVGTVPGWRKAGPAESGLAAAAEPGAPPPPAADEKAADEKNTILHARAVANARQELAEYDSRAKLNDRELSDKLVEAQQKLVESEEMLRELQEERDTLLRIVNEERDLERQEANLKTQLQETRQKFAGPPKPEVLESIQRPLANVQAELTRLTETKTHARAAKMQKVIDLRKKIVRQEEEIRLLERERSAWREDDDRRHEAALERIRTLEGIAPATSDHSQRSTDRKLEALQREVSELRREIQRLRADKKN
jgi:RNA polymerase sigma factor (sigma-70 family)